MAERSSELKKVDLDPVSTAAGAGRDEQLERYENSGQLELSSDAAESEDTDHIKAQIEQTRSQMGETIDAIQERLSYANISEQVSETVNNAIETAKDTAYDATIGKAVNFMKNVGDEVSHSGAFRAVKKNPFPLALIGLGAGLLAYQSYSGKSPRRGSGSAYDKAFYEDGSRAANFATSGSTTRGIAEKASRAVDGISDKASSAIDTVSSSAGAAYETVSGTVSNAYSEAGEFASRAYDRAGEYGTLAHEKYDEYLEENPLALGAIAVALGAAVGLAIPSTNYEGKLMGDARENLMERAQEAAGSLVEKAKHVAAEAGQTIKEEARTLAQ